MFVLFASQLVTQKILQLVCQCCPLMRTGLANRFSRTLTPAWSQWANLLPPTPTPGQPFPSYNNTKIKMSLCDLLIITYINAHVCLLLLKGRYPTLTRLFNTFHILISWAIKIVFTFFYFLPWCNTMTLSCICSTEH